MQVMHKLFIATFVVVVANSAHSGAVGIRCAVSAVAVAMAVGSRPPWGVWVTAVGLIGWFAPTALAAAAWVALLAVASGAKTAPKPAAPSAIPAHTAQETTTSDGKPRRAYRGGGINIKTANNSMVLSKPLGVFATREHWLEAVARAANAEPWCVGVITGSAATKFGWRNGPALRNAATALGLESTGSVAAVRARVNEWANTVEAPNVVHGDPGVAAIAAACPIISQ